MFAKSIWLLLKEELDCENSYCRSKAQDTAYTLLQYLVILSSSLPSQSDHLEMCHRFHKEDMGKDPW